MSSLLSTLARQLSGGEHSRSYSGRTSGSMVSVPSFNDFNSATHIEGARGLPGAAAGSERARRAAQAAPMHFSSSAVAAREEFESLAERKFGRHSVDMGQLYSAKSLPADATATVHTTAEAPGEGPLLPPSSPERAPFALQTRHRGSSARAPPVAPPGGGVCGLGRGGNAACRSILPRPSPSRARQPRRPPGTAAQAA